MPAGAKLVIFLSSFQRAASQVAAGTKVSSEQDCSHAPVRPQLTDSARLPRLTSPAACGKKQACEGNVNAEGWYDLTAHRFQREGMHAESAWGSQVLKAHAAGSFEDFVAALHSKPILHHTSVSRSDGDVSSAEEELKVAPRPASFTSEAM